MLWNIWWHIQQFIPRWHIPQHVQHLRWHVPQFTSGKHNENKFSANVYGLFQLLRDLEEILHVYDRFSRFSTLIAGTVNIYTLNSLKKSRIFLGFIIDTILQGFMSYVERDNQYIIAVQKILKFLITFKNGICTLQKF